MSLTVRIAVLFSVASAVLLLAADHTFPLSGRITDASGASLPNATVRLYSRNSSESFTATADSQGNYNVVLPEGEYLLEAHATGLNLPKAPRLIAIAAPQTLPLQLEVAELSSSIAVTATGTAQSLDELAKAVDVVSREELDQRAIATVSDGIREVAGLRVEQRGGPGANTTIQIRGLRTFDTAVLVDGMRFRDVAATQGDASSFLTDLLLVDTARVEVLRGASSSIYGTNAIGGVINVVTDSGSGDLHGSLTADGGGLGQFRGVARLGGGAFDNRFHYSGGLGHQNVTDGVGGYGRYRNTTGNGTADYSFRPGLVLSGRLLATNVFGQLYNTAGAAPAKTLPPTGYINAIAPTNSQLKLAEQSLPYDLGNATFIPALGDPDYYRTASFVSTLVALQQQVSAPLSYRVSYQALLSNRGVISGPGGAGFQPAYRTESGFNGRIDTLRGQANYLLGTHQLLSAGYEFEREFFDAPSTDSNPVVAKQVNARTQVAERSSTVDAQDQIRLFQDRLQISLSGRIQHFALDNPQFLGTVPVYAGATSLSPPNAYTGDASVAWFFKSTGTKIRSHGGNGYRKPSLYELFGTSFSASAFTAYGDPRLKPERSIAIDGGMDQYFASQCLRLSASYFYTRLQQVIAFDSTGLIQPATDPFARSSGYRNTGGGIARGAEVSLEAKPFRATMIRGSYTYTNARDRYSQFADGTIQSPRISPQSFGLVVLQQFGPHFDASMDLLFASDFLYQLTRRTFIFPGPRKVGFSAGYTRPVSERWKMRIYTRVTNLTNQTYYEDAYRTPGIVAISGITFSF